LRAAVTGLNDTQLNTEYRPGGWTVRQVVHHLADSHLHSYQRFRNALTQDRPSVNAYPQELWAELVDARSAPVDLSLALLDALHARWVLLLRSMGPAEFARSFVHSELGPVTLDQNLALYAWHGDHHIAHVTELRKRNGWN
jgi:uncharacterized damage-inducible protein DinB